jgi:hypothetical protein
MCRASQNVTLYDKPLPAEIIAAGGRCRSTRAMHLSTIPLEEWGANLGTALPGLDASDWTGVSFWARRSQSSRGSIRVELADARTDPATGTCRADVPRDALAEGCDRFGAWASIGSDWRFFTLPFTDFRQGGWGVYAGRLEPGDLRALTFLFPAGRWDVWIDDVAFYRHSAE